MNTFDTALGGSPGGPEAFAALRDLIALVASPEAAQARADGLQAQLAAIARGSEKLTGDRQAFDNEMAEARRKLGEDSDALARRMIAARDKELELRAFEERIEARAKKVGYWEPPTSIGIGDGGMTMSTFGQAEPPRPATAEPLPSRLSEERFGSSTLTRQTDKEAETSSVASANRAQRARRGA